MKVIKWVRKNNRKLMAVVVIIILFGFIGGGELLSLISRRGRTEAFAQFGDGHKITNYDLYQARQELEVMTNLGVPIFLRSQSLHGMLLGELLFSDRRPQPEVANQLLQMLGSNRYRVTDHDVTALYKGKQSGAVYWWLLSHEAQKAGIAVARDTAGQILEQLIPNVFEGQTYAQRIHGLMQGGTPEKAILDAFAKLVAVLQYSQMVCAMEDLTGSQIDHLISGDNETLDINAVALEVPLFTRLLDPNRPVPEDRLQGHFNQYKGFFPGQITADNPYGWGYKIPPRVQLEYLVVRLDDVLATVPKPTQEQAETYYHRNIEQFTNQVRTDPNDPNSPSKDVTRPFAEVLDEIQRRWVSDKAREKAAAILLEGRTLAEIPGSLLENQGVDREKLRQEAPAYGPIAEKLTQKHGVKVVVGQTGLLTLEEIASEDRVLSRLVVEGRTQWRLPLAQLVFTADPVGVEDLMTVNAQKARLYESLGPAQERNSSYRLDAAGEVMAVVRVVQAIQDREPADLNETYDHTPVVLGQTDSPKTFSVKEKVAEDLRGLEAMAMAKSKAQELETLVKESGWTQALSAFNRTYRQQAGLDPNGPDLFSLRFQGQRNRVLSGQAQMWAMRGEREAAAWRLYQTTMAQKQFTDRLYDLIPPDSNGLAATPVTVESPGERTVYCIKDLSVKRFPLQEYTKAKGLYAYQEDFVGSQSLAAVHFNPENILQRMQFREILDQSKPRDANETTSP